MSAIQNKSNPRKEKNLFLDTKMRKSRHNQTCLEVRGLLVCSLTAKVGVVRYLYRLKWGAQPWDRAKKYLFCCFCFIQERQLLRTNLGKLEVNEENRQNKTKRQQQQQEGGKNIYSGATDLVQMKETWGGSRRDNRGTALLNEKGNWIFVHELMQLTCILSNWENNRA